MDAPSTASPEHTDSAPAARAPARRGWPAAWIALATLSLAAITAWQKEPEPVALVLAAAGAIGAALTVASLRRPIGWGLAAVAALAIAIGLAADETRKLRIIAAHYEGYSIADQERRAQRMASSVEEVADVLAAATAAVAADSARLQRMGSEAAPQGLIIAPPLPGSVESALLVFRHGQLVDYAGQTRVAVAPGDTGVHLLRTAFHTALVSRSSSADGVTQVVGVALLASAPPADRFARSLAQVVAGRSNATRVSFESADSAYARGGSSMLFVSHDDKPILAVRAYPFSEGETRVLRLQLARARTAIPLAFAALFVLLVSWRRPARTRHRLAAMVALLAVVAIAPLSALSNVSSLFNSASYFAPMGGPLTANVASLLLTSILVLGALLLRLRGRGLATSRLPALLLVLVIAGVGPFVLRDLARGITLPPAGVHYGLWIAWQLAIALAGVSILLAGAAAGQVALGQRRGLHPFIAPGIAIIAALLAPVLWDAPGAWPAWYPMLWVLSIATLALTRRNAGALVVAATFVAGSGAVTLTWGATIRERMELAAYDITQLSPVDPNALELLERFARSIDTDSVRLSAPDALLRQYAASELAMAGYPARLARWAPGQLEAPVVDLALAPVSDPMLAQASIASLARTSGQPEFRAVVDGATTNLVAAIPSSDGMVTTVAVPPRTRLLPADPFAALTGVAGERGTEPPYRLTLGGPADATTDQRLHWVRRGSAMHGDGVAGADTTGGGDRARMVHVEIDLRELDVLIPRGALLVLLDVAIVLLIWAATATADGALGRWLRARGARLTRSYRVRLTVTLIAFFLAPAAIFASWSAYRLRDDDRAARELLVREALRVASANLDDNPIATNAEEVRAPLFLYQDAQLVAASDPVLDALAPLGRLLPADLSNAEEAFGPEDVFASRRLPVRDREALIGFRRLPQAEPSLILATPARGDEFALDERREDLGMLVLFATAFGVVAALWSSGFAARALARPVGALREAAMALAAGKQEPTLGAAPATEFAPVYRAFSRMAQDLTTSRAALERAQRQTEAVLQHVASGVVALRRDGSVSLANPRAVSLLGLAYESRLATSNTSEFPSPFVPHIREFLAGTAEEDAFELQIGARQVRARLTRLSEGAVLTIDDVTELASAQRVLAWGEMARQIAHEIKNPLTPIRLGVQHLRRAFRDGRSDFETILETNVGRVLSEIDHLDEIARAFSRYGMAPENRAKAEPVDVAAVVRDVIALEQLGQEGGVEWQFEPRNDGTPAVALAQTDELKEVVLNLLENARLANSSVVRIIVDVDDGDLHLEVHDNGSGIAQDVMPRIFEPHFSTRTSGSGLGLAISRRLIEGWGGTIAVTNGARGGTVVRITLRTAESAH